MGGIEIITVGDELVHSSLRFSLGRDNTAEEIDYAIEKIVTEVVRPTTAGLDDSEFAHRAE